MFLYILKFFGLNNNLCRIGFFLPRNSVKLVKILYINILNMQICFISKVKTLQDVSYFTDEHTFGVCALRRQVVYRCFKAPMSPSRQRCLERTRIRQWLGLGLDALKSSVTALPGRRRWGLSRCQSHLCNIVGMVGF